MDYSELNLIGSSSPHIRTKTGTNSIIGSVEDMPELAVSLLPSFRGKGIGTVLLEKFLEEIKQRNLPGISLSVQKENPAHRLYERLGFEIVREQADTWVMVYHV